jgi:hypothetical protein
MELLLNLAWLAVAGSIVCLWLQSGSEKSKDRRRQVIAVAVLTAVLFPVISVSDDLMAAQTASEVDSNPRRDHLIPSGMQPIHPMVAFIAPILFMGLGFAFVRYVAPGVLPVQRPKRPELAGIDNRPPPAMA